MAYELRDNTGSIFKNKRKDSSNPKAADVTGKAKINGVLYWVSGWRKVRDNGEGWYSLSFKEADETAQVDTQTGEPQRDDPGF